MTETFSSGDIIRGAKHGKDESFHPIIYFGEIDSTFFDGGMITHSSKFGNIELQDEHFTQKIDTNSRPSYFVKNYLIKKQDWGPFTKIGQLSERGLEFVKSQLEGTTPVVWEAYNP